MTPNVSPIGRYTFSGTDELFLDANIWLFVYGPQTPHNARRNIYSSAFHRILSARSRIFIDVLVVSEFINVWARWYHRQWPSFNGHNFKDFRRSPDFQRAARSIAADSRRVLGHCSRIDSDFSTLDIKAIVNEYEQGNSDFNDQNIRELCDKRQMTLVTDDSDFQVNGISILTANRRLLNL